MEKEQLTNIINLYYFTEEMGIEFFTCRNIAKAVETDMAFFRLKDSVSPARPFFAKVVGI